MSYADRAVLTEAQMRERINLMVMAKLAPHRVKIPKGWRPRTAYERHIARLMAAVAEREAEKKGS